MNKIFSEKALTEKAEKYADIEHHGRTVTSLNIMGDYMKGYNQCKEDLRALLKSKQQYYWNKEHEANKLKKKCLRETSELGRAKFTTNSDYWKTYGIGRTGTKLLKELLAELGQDSKGQESGSGRAHPELRSIKPSPSPKSGKLRQQADEEVGK